MSIKIKAVICTLFVYDQDNLLAVLRNIRESKTHAQSLAGNIHNKNRGCRAYEWAYWFLMFAK
jgi:hypothetical protein